MKDLSEKVVMITGAAGNLGSATVSKFMGFGAQLALVDHSAERLRERYDEFRTSPSVYLSPSTDLTDPSQVENIVSDILEKFEGIDVLVNITGGFQGGTPVHETGLEVVKFLFELNVMTMFNSSHAVVPGMIKAGSGSIINIGARPGLKGTSKMGAYSASKSAVIRLTESMSEELKQKNIRVNCLLPGTIDTQRNREDMPEADYSRWVKPEALADVITFLASDNSSAITGASIPAYAKG
jgi:NAD(P)-dependent dehydrogenase (short-subunit alcohol dehydrogenase family)